MSAEQGTRPFDDDNSMPGLRICARTDSARRRVESQARVPDSVPSVRVDVRSQLGKLKGPDFGGLRRCLMAGQPPMRAATEQGGHRRPRDKRAINGDLAALARGREAR